MLIRAPRNPRELFETFRFHDTAGDTADGVNGIVAATDLAGVSAAQIHYAAFGRLIEAAALLARQEGYEPATHLRQCLNAEAFQTNLLDRMLTAYPEKRRLLLVHIPKCAGSDLTMHLMGRFASVSHRIVDRTWMPPPKMHAAIKKFVEDAGFSADIFVHGHIPLQQYLAGRQVRFGDEVFSILRDPTEMVVSKINYVITRFARDPGATKIDTAGWLAFLNRSTMERALATGDMLPLARDILHSPNLIPKNLICTYLGRGDAETATALCARSDIELTDVTRYQYWLRERWGIESETRQNASVRHISIADLGEADMARVNAATAEDRKLHDALLRALEFSGACSIRGPLLSRFLC